jgi:peptidyl-tRNA hydrolase, PTH1 family
MRLIVGLGNPGAEYEWTRHNLGFMLIDKLAAQAGATVKRKECRSLVGSATIENERLWLVKPQTFMNLSGEAVTCLATKEEIEDLSKSLIVISDDLALPFGTIRLRERGSAGGHNGLKSIIGATGTNEFMRLRIGIQPEHPVNDAKAFVLDEFRKAQRDEVENILDKAAEAVHSVLRDGIKRAMSLFNS